MKQIITKTIDIQGFKKGISIGLGIILTLATSAILAVAVTGTINTFSSGNVVDASQINTNFASLKTAIEGITSSQWTSSGSNIYYNAGKVLIGTNTPAQTESTLTVAGDIVSNGNAARLRLMRNGQNYIDFTNNYPLLVRTISQDDLTYFVRLAIDINGNFGFGFHTLSPSFTERMEVNGDIKVGTSGSNGCLKNFGGGTITGTCSSDEKLKKDIRPMESVLDKVSQLVPKTYHWRSEEYPNKKFGTQKEYGLVAQDVEKIFPDMVENNSNGLKAIHYERLPILTVQAVKEIKSLYDHEKKFSEDLSIRLNTTADQLKSATEELASVKTQNTASQKENARLREEIKSLTDSVRTHARVSGQLEERLNALERMQLATARKK